MRTLRRKRVLLIGPLVLVLLIRLTVAWLQGESPVWAMLALAAGVTAFATLILADATRKRRHPGSSDWAAVLRLSELQSCPRFFSWSGNVNKSAIKKSTGDQIAGRVSILRDRITFEPGRLYERAGVRRFDIPWSDVSNLEIARNPPPISTDMILTLADGSHLGLQVRGWKAFLKAVSQPTGWGN